MFLRINLFTFLNHFFIIRRQIILINFNSIIQLTLGGRKDFPICTLCISSYSVFSNQIRKMFLKYFPVRNRQISIITSQITDRSMLDYLLLLFTFFNNICYTIFNYNNLEPYLYTGEFCILKSLVFSGICLSRHRFLCYTRRVISYD